MKLVEILAETMGEWPSTTKYYAQDRSGVVYPWVTKPRLTGGAWEPEGTMESRQGVSIDLNTEAHTYTPDLASDWDEALVTKEMWLAEKGRGGCTTDKELTLLAAKAAGLFCNRGNHIPDWWKPLLFPDFALELASDLGMEVNMENDYAVTAKTKYEHGNFLFSEVVGEKGKLAAVCRVIVRAAADIGKTMGDNVQ